jgi:hypothetical protein
LDDDADTSRDEIEIKGEGEQEWGREGDVEREHEEDRERDHRREGSHGDEDDPQNGGELADLCRRMV